jgi:hypothetical protein
MVPPQPLLAALSCTPPSMRISTPSMYVSAKPVAGDRPLVEVEQDRASEMVPATLHADRARGQPPGEIARASDRPGARPCHPCDWSRIELASSRSAARSRQLPAWSGPCVADGRRPICDLRASSSGS